MSLALEEQLHLLKAVVQDPVQLQLLKPDPVLLTAAKELIPQIPGIVMAGEAPIKEENKAEQLSDRN